MRSFIHPMGVVGLFWLAAMVASSVTAADTVDKEVPQEDLVRIRQACPAGPVVEPKAGRRVLVYSKWGAYRHDSIPWGAAAMRILGEKTGAFEPVLSSDSAAFEPESLKRFDVVIFNNNCEKGIDEPGRREALFEFVKNGGGVVGVHSASYDPNWPEFIDLLGACSVAHPWNAGSTVSVKVDAPDSPLVKPFGKGPFRHSDEIFTFSHFRPERSRILLSLDKEGTDMTVPGIRADAEPFPLSWIHDYGKGRVFYCAFGHEKHVFWNPAVLEYYLRGIQYAAGDLDLNP